MESVESSYVLVDSPENSFIIDSTASSLVIIEDYFRPQESLPSKPGEYCGIREFDILNSSSKNATTSQLIAALDIVTDIFDQNDIPYAVMGGFSLQLRGMKSSVARQNVDLAVPISILDEDESAWLTIFKDDLRILRPSVFLTGVKDTTHKILFVQVPTGGGLDGDDNNSAAQSWVRVDLRFVTPRHQDSSTSHSSSCSLASSNSPFPDSSPNKNYYCLNLRYILHDKLCMISHPPTSTSERKRDITDVSYILTEHSDKIGHTGWIPLHLRKNFITCYDAFAPNDLKTDYFARALWIPEEEVGVGDFLWAKWTATDVNAEENNKPAPEEKEDKGSSWFWTRWFSRRKRDDGEKK
ncbi:hypothetical protein B0T20DRAFT_496188 [Sordaria brevicollis]|uniref:Uncharacterized protein n=1 Tax=Sordaria brevicollis TaxID=83679 RepID=A0AAE0PH98_SORBR|nr:hypothetical protein B0T20DRAFT_496188 [Sordaria brevicollis]